MEILLIISLMLILILLIFLILAIKLFIDENKKKHAEYMKDYKKYAEQRIKNIMKQDQQSLF